MRSQRTRMGVVGVSALLAVAIAWPGRTSAQESPDGAAEVRGFVTLRDVRGETLPPMDGWFRLMALHSMGNERGPWRAESFEVRVVAGEWSARLEDRPGVDRLAIGELFQEDRELLVESPDSPVAIPSPGERIEIVAVRPEPCVLRVLDARTGKDLRGVTLVTSETGVEHPGNGFEDRIVREDASSPIHVPADRSGWRTEWHVGARGHAWTLVTLDMMLGGERVVALEPGADLELHVRGTHPAMPAILTARAAGATLARAPLTGDGALLLEGLPVGPVDLVVETVDAPERRLGSARVHLAAGVRTTASLDLPGEPPPRASASGTILVAKEWGLRQLSMGLFPSPFADHRFQGSPYRRVLAAAAEDASANGFDRFRWEVADLVPGTYYLTLETLPRSEPLELPPGARVERDLEVPAPVDVELLVVDDATGEAIEGQPPRWAHWNGRQDVWIEGVQAKSGSGAGAYKLRCPRWPIQVFIEEPGFMLQPSWIDPGAGEGRHTLRLARIPGLRLELRDGWTRIPVPMGWLTSHIEALRGTEPALWRLDGPGTVLGISSDMLGLEMLVDEPGSYRLRLPKLAGYKAAPVQEVAVRPGEITELLVRLEREH